MKKNGFCSVFMLVVFLFTGCAASTDKLLVRKDLESVNQIRLVRHEFPGYMKETTASTVASMGAAAPFMLFGAVGGGIGGALYGSIKSSVMRRAGSEMERRYNLPDFAELVHKEFSEKLPKSIPDWPELIVEPSPVIGDLPKQPGYFLTVKTAAVVSSGKGLQTTTDAQLLGPNQTVLWKKTASYTSNELDRSCTFERLEADDGKLLHEEIASAVEKTVAALIDHLKNEPTTGQMESEPKNRNDKGKTARCASS